MQHATRVPFSFWCKSLPCGICPRPLDDYAAPVDVYEDLIHRLEEDGQEVDVTETMSTRLGDDHPLVVELRRREALADVKLLDGFIKEGLGSELAAIVYKK